jgi:hypothetical protein
LPNTGNAAPLIARDKSEEAAAHNGQKTAANKTPAATAAILIEDI